MAHSKSEIRKAKNLLNKYAPKGEQLAYINSKEAKLLKSKGGAGKMTKAGIRSYFDDSGDDYGGYDPGPSGPSNNNGDTNPAQNNQPKNILSRIGGFIKGAALTALTAATFGVGTIAAMGINKGISYAAKNNKGFTNKGGTLVANARLSGSQIFPNSNKKSNPNINMGGGDGGDTNPAQNISGRIVKLSPTSAEVSQSKATDVTYDSRKTKARGRSMTILTSAKGIGRNMGSVLGSKSLLGA